MMENQNQPSDRATNKLGTALQDQSRNDIYLSPPLNFTGWQDPNLTLLSQQENSYYLNKLSVNSGFNTGQKTQYHIQSAIQPSLFNGAVSSDNVGGVGRTTNYSRISSYLPHNVVIDASQALKCQAEPLKAIKVNYEHLMLL